MARKRKFEAIMTPAEKEASLFNYQNLQRACIVRGIDFMVLITLCREPLTDWFIRNYYNPIDNSRLDAFDTWREEMMLSRGKNEPFVRLGFIGELDHKGEVISTKKPKKFKKPKKKKKRERNESLGGLFAGTKKELTFICQREGKTLQETIKTVMKKFPDAVEKSIGIWYKKSQKAGAK